MTACASVLFLSACSPINSLKPFDRQQASVLLKSNYISLPAKQKIAINLPNSDHWKRIDLSLNGNGTPLMLVPQGQSEEYWTESIRTNIRVYRNEPDITAEKFSQQQIDRTKKDCLLMNSITLRETEKSITYLIDMAGCRHDRNQTQIVKAFNGIDGVYVVRYSSLSQKVSDQEFSQMTRVIKNAQLVPAN